jgi:hypothetical protein
VNFYPRFAAAPAGNREAVGNTPAKPAELLDLIEYLF